MYMYTYMYIHTYYMEKMIFYFGHTMLTSLNIVQISFDLSKT